MYMIMYNFKHNENGNKYYKVSYLSVYSLYLLDCILYLLKFP